MGAVVAQAGAQIGAKLASSIVGKAERAIIGIFDPGQKRDANREARAQMWFEFAEGGSITAARRLHGGSVVQYTVKERAMYQTRWTQFAKDKPDLAQQALQMGDLGIPEPGSDTTPPSLSPDVVQQLQAEMDDYANAHLTTAPAPSSSSTGTPALATVAAAAGTSPTMVIVVVVLVVVGVAVAVFAAKR